MPNRIVTVEECDARDDDSSNAVDYIKTKKEQLPAPCVLKYDF